MWHHKWPRAEDKDIVSWERDLGLHDAGKEKLRLAGGENVLVPEQTNAANPVGGQEHKHHEIYPNLPPEQWARSSLTVQQAIWCLQKPPYWAEQGLQNTGRSPKSVPDSLQHGLPVIVGWSSWHASTNVHQRWWNTGTHLCPRWRPTGICWQNQWCQAAILTLRVGCQLLIRRQTQSLVWHWRRLRQCQIYPVPK